VEAKGLFLDEYNLPIEPYAGKLRLTGSNLFSAPMETFALRKWSSERSTDQRWSDREPDLGKRKRRRLFNYLRPLCFLLTIEPIELLGLVDADGQVEKSLVIRAAIAELVANTLKKSDDLKVEAARLRDSGMTMEQIASAVGRNKSTVSRWLG